LLFLATSDGVVTLEREVEAQRKLAYKSVAASPEADEVIAPRHFTSVSARGGVVFAGATDGVLRSDDAGQTWQSAGRAMRGRHVRWLTLLPSQMGGPPSLSRHSTFEQMELEESSVLVGTEPAAIFVSRDGGDTWREAPEVARLRDAKDWYLPYSPEAGCVRGFAYQEQRIYAAVEQGGLLRSDDTGATWHLVAGSNGDPHVSLPEGFIHNDVHSVKTHIVSPDLIFAPTGGGFYYSADGGETWERRYVCYCQAVWVNPGDPSHLILGPADGVDENGRIEESRDGGRTWHAASTGLDVPWPDHMVERFVQVEGHLLAVLSNGHLLAAPLDTLMWQRILPEIPGIEAATPMM
jgi:photosystem II stability/assembly factor-like uncharacterized protein